MATASPNRGTATSFQTLKRVAFGRDQARKAKKNSPANAKHATQGEHSVVETRETRILYAIAYESVSRAHGAYADIEYTHAVDAGEALRVFWTVKKRGTGNTKVVGVAPVVGYKALDDNAMRVVV